MLTAHIYRDRYIDRLPATAQHLHHHCCYLADPLGVSLQRHNGLGALTLQQTDLAFFQHAALFQLWDSGYRKQLVLAVGHAHAQGTKHIRQCAANANQQLVIDLANHIVDQFDHTV